MLTASLVCLALNVYHEAKNQSFLGQVAVAQVVMNRVKDKRYPNTVCEVVKQGQTYKWKPSFPIKTNVNSVGIVMASDTPRIIRHGKMLCMLPMVFTINI